MRGLAPAAQVTFLAMGADATGGLAVPFDLEAGLLQPAYDDGARLHNDSWGSSTQAGYSAHSADVDDFTWAHPDMLVVFAAGNAGPGPATVSPPSTAKNCLTVGAAESVRPLPATITLATNLQDTDFDPTTAPTNFPLQADGWDQQADDPDDIAAFSSRGPTADGRIAPDLVAPGSWILSCRSSVSVADVGRDGLVHAALGTPPPYADDADGVATHAEAVGRGLPGGPFFGTFDQTTPDLPPGAAPDARQHYFYDSGTSMAAPVATGAAAVLRQYLRQRRGVPSPSAALLKAVLVNGARVPAGRSAAPDHERGFGWLDLQGAIAPRPTGQQTWADDVELAVATGDVRRLPVQVADPAHPLRATLVWTDAAGAGVQNKLYLRLVAPDGTAYDGDTTAFPAVTNNVQRVHVAGPAAGTWTIEVHGVEVLDGVPTLPGQVRQDFVVAVTNAVGFSARPVDVVQAIDVSGSTGFFGWLEPVKERAGQLVDGLRVGDRAGVVGFDATASAAGAVAPLAGPDSRLAVGQAIARLAPGGVTSLGAGLQRALAELAAVGDAGHARAVVLVSDGHENTPPWVGGAAADSPPAWYAGADRTEVLPGVPAGAAVHTVALGLQSGHALLQDVALATGGTFHGLTSAGDLPALHEAWLHLQARIGGEEVVAVGSGAVDGAGVLGRPGAGRLDRPTGTGDALATDLARSLVTGHAAELDPGFLSGLHPVGTHEVPVDDTVTEVTFVVSWHEPDRAVTLQATAPGGRRVDARSAHAAGGGRSWAWLRVRHPAPGEWRLLVRPRAARGTWWGTHAYTWGATAETPVGLRATPTGTPLGAGEVRVEVAWRGAEQAPAASVVVEVEAPTTTVAEALAAHAGPLAGIGLPVRPDAPGVAADVLRLAVLDARLRAEGRTAVPTERRRTDHRLDGGAPVEVVVTTAVAGLHRARLVAGATTAAGHPLRRQARLDLVV